MNIGLVDVDSHNFPNLALMKLSAWHKGQGDTTGLADMFGSYDLTDDYDDSLSRLNFLRSMYRVQPFAQPFRDFTTSHTPPNGKKTWHGGRI